jgi:hypothetical protein
MASQGLLNVERSSPTYSASPIATEVAVSKSYDVHVKLGEALFAELLEYMKANGFENMSEAVRACVRSTLRGAK